MTAADHRALATEEFDALPPVAPVAAATASAVDGVFAPALPRQRRRGPLLALVAAGYLAITLSYSVFWRRVPVLDIAAIASGFVLRAVAGGVAAPVTLSRWFILVVTFAAVFVAAGKRYAELRRTDVLAA